VILDITKSVTLQVPVDRVWALLQDPPAVAACLPNVRDFRQVDAVPGKWATVLVEKLGPFAVQVALVIEVTEDAAAHRITARVAGDDKGGAARVRGDLVAGVVAAGDSAATLDITSNVEVLGRLATLGAVPMKRRADQIFELFVKNIGQALEGQRG
jgi:carbon monoxide dehydrogenase subunit G